jgi:F0F1-type ATP synthase assembly protein I
MSGQSEGAFASPGGDRRTPERRARAQGMDIGWTVSGYLFSGMLAYGIIGWLIGRAVHASLLLPIGMLVGLAISIGFIIYRYGVQGAAQPGTSAQAQKEMTGDR